MATYQVKKKAPLAQHIRFYRAGQEHGDPARAHIDLNFELKHDGNLTSGWAATVHPQFAPLMAAAPDMLKAAKHVLAWLDNATTESYEVGRDKKVREELRAAIAKSTGS